MPKVQCIGKTRDSVVDQTCAKWAARTSDELSIGDTHVVYGQCLYEGCLLLLLNPLQKENILCPIWFPESLFTVIDNSIPSEWIYMHYPKRDFAGPLTAIWGYKELATSLNHYRGILEGNAEELNVFAGYQLLLNRYYA